MMSEEGEFEYEEGESEILDSGSEAPSLVAIEETTPQPRERK